MPEAESGGIHIVLYPMKNERYERLRADWEEGGRDGEDDGDGLP